MGRDRRNENRGEVFTKMNLRTMETEAWHNLTIYAQALYPWLKLEWRGPKSNNNGQIQLSVRQASELIGASKKPITTAFHDLQAKGFIVMTQPAKLGSGGAGESPTWEITEIAMPGNGERPRNLFQKWKPDNDYPVYRAAAQNPKGKNGRRNVARFRVLP